MKEDSLTMTPAIEAAIRAVVERALINNGILDAGGSFDDRWFVSHTEGMAL